MQRIKDLGPSIMLVIASSCVLAASFVDKTFAYRYALPSAPKLHDVAAGRTPRIRADKSGTLHVVYADLPESSKSPDIFYTHSTDGGVTWSAGVDISRTPGVSTDPALALESNGALDVVWKDTSPGEARPDIFFSRSADGGKTWTNVCDVSNTPGASTEPAISCGPDGVIQAVWIDTTSGPTHPDVYHSVSSNAGETWSKPEDLSNTPGISSEPDVCVGGDNTVHVVWLDTTPGPTHPDIFYSRMTPGSTWTKYVNVSHSPRVSDHPRMATGENNKVYVCWHDNSQKRKAPDIWSASSDDGTTWSKTLNMSDTPGVSSEPCIAADGAGCVAVAWVDSTVGSDRPDICARASLDSAKTFSSILDLSHTTGKSNYPDVALCGGKLYVVWEEITGTKRVIKATNSGELKNLLMERPGTVKPLKEGTE